MQGEEAMDLLRSLVLAPVAIAVQNEQTERLNRCSTREPFRK